ncbi:MAG: SpoIIE family protein phosphatase [Actinomycetota bacterium]|nr:SpoIIE family protein phosphatase [Actinomycetota bacterium]
MTVAPKVDLDNCEDEPIHIPGAIQPHGVLIAVDDDRTVRAASANLPEWFGVDAGAARGRSLAEVVGDGVDAALHEVVASIGTERVGEVRLPEPSADLVATVYRSTGLVVIEIEGDTADAAGQHTVSRTSTMALNRASTTAAVAEAAAVAVRQLTGFDRVMVYRFDAEWNGEVIAEEKREDLNTFLGLHYPSTDIPSQARELYRRNWIRLIADIGYTPAAIVPELVPPGRPLDLSDSTIRSVSPIHIEYLQNMGVTASMSVSIIVDDDLWGLIACHHYSGPHQPPPSARSLAEYLGQLVSVRVRDTTWNEMRQRSLELTSLANNLADAFAARDRRPLTTVLVDAEADVLKLAGATGALVRFGGEAVRLGRVPGDDVIGALLASWPVGEETLLVESIGATPAAVATAGDTGGEVAGALGVAMTPDRRDVALWFRPERIRSVDWAGDPYAKEAAAELPGARLSPRRSFDLWREVVRGRSLPWEPAEVTAAYRFARHLSAALLRRDRDLLSVASDLQKIMLPDELPTVPGWEVDAFYSPDGSGLVGGDWYDVLPVGDRVALVLGDVAGHGLPAASAMAQARNALRAYLADDPTPERALERLDNLVRTTMAGELLSAVVAVLDPASGRVRLALAGHLPPLVLRGAEAAYPEPDVNRLVGVREGSFTGLDVALAAGDLLLLYSDGLVEVRHQPIDHRLDLLGARALELDGESLTGWTSRLADALTPGGHDDDVTMLALRRG